MLGGGAAPADVLLARLQGHAEGHLAVRVLGDANHAARHLALEGLAGGEVGGVGAAVAHRYAEALRGADDHVRAPLTRRFQEREAQQVRRHGDVRVFVVGALGHVAVVAHRAVGGRVLEKAAERVLAEDEVLGVLHDHVHPHRLGAALHHLDRLRVAVLGHEEGGGVAAAVHAFKHHHRLGRGGRLVEQGGIGDLHAGKIDRHVLEVQERLQPPLRNLGLVGGVLRVPGWIFQNVALDHRRRVGAVVPHPDEGPPVVVLLASRLRVVKDLLFGAGGREVERPVGADGIRDGSVNEGVERLGTERVEHRVHVGLGRAEVACGERVGKRKVDGHRRRAVVGSEGGRRGKLYVHYGVCLSDARSCDGLLKSLQQTLD
jgi:hypothetical protein